MSIITLEDYNNDKDCPELVDAYDITDFEESPELYEDDWDNFADSF